MKKARRSSWEYGRSGFAALPLELLNSEAYISLSFAAAKALPYFIVKPKRPFGSPESYQSDISLSYSEAKHFGFANSTFHKVIIALVQNGFIDPVEKGGLRGDSKSNNQYRLSRRWKKFGAKDFEGANWAGFEPAMRSKATPKRETYSTKIGNETGPTTIAASQTDAVEAKLP